MNDKMEVVMRLVAADWPNCSKGEILEHLPDMVEVADALLAAAGETCGSPGMHLADDYGALLARAEAAEAKVAEMLVKFRELRSGFNDVVTANSEWESSSADLEAKVARLERRLEPLTEDEAIRVLGCSSIPGMCGVDVMNMVCFADRIRARRSE